MLHAVLPTHHSRRLFGKVVRLRCGSSRLGPSIAKADLLLGVEHELTVALRGQPYVIRSCQERHRPDRRHVDNNTLLTSNGKWKAPKESSQACLVTNSVLTQHGPSLVIPATHASCVTLMNGC